MAELLPHAFDADDLDRSPVAAPACRPGCASGTGAGTVFVHPDSVGGQRVWTAYWERSTGFADEPSGRRARHPGGGPDLAGLDDAVAWGAPARRGSSWSTPTVSSPGPAKATRQSSVGRAVRNGDE